MAYGICDVCGGKTEPIIGNYVSCSTCDSGGSGLPETYSKADHEHGDLHVHTPVWVGASTGTNFFYDGRFWTVRKDGSIQCLDYSRHVTMLVKGQEDPDDNGVYTVVGTFTL